jgi:hypothetical protein
MICLAAWINRNQQNVIEYLQEEVKVLKEQLGKGRGLMTIYAEGWLQRPIRSIGNTSTGSPP